jgi:hypothetical protein
MVIRQKVPTFISFDFDNDRVLKDFIIEQARRSDSPFSIVDLSLKEAAPLRTWEAKAEAAINRAEVVLVMVGSRTYCAPGVLKEIAIARRLGKRIAQVIGYKDGNYTAVPDAGRLYKWSWMNLESILHGR